MASSHLATPLPSYAIIREFFNYDKDSGVLSWRKSKSNSGPAGSEAGSISGSRRNVMFDGVNFKVHRIIWCWVTGDDPVCEIDHKDMNSANNKWKNLRLTDRSGNGANQTKRKNNRSGFKGVSKNGHGWQANITKEGVRYYLGCFETPEEAHAAYVAKAAELFGEFARAA